MKNLTDTAAFTTKFVLEDNKDIIYVSHNNEDGAWQFFSDDDFENFERVGKIVGLNEIMDTDPTLKELSDMKTGYFAIRKFKGDKWVIKRLE